MGAILEAIVEHLPPPAGDRDAPLSALIFDAVYDSYQGVIPFFRVFDGTLKKGDEIKIVSTGKTFEVDKVGFFEPSLAVVEGTRAR